MQYIYLWMAYAVIYKSGYLPLSFGGYSKYFPGHIKHLIEHLIALSFKTCKYCNIVCL